jgi:outer membrane lipoprotein carrier protein
MMKEKRFVAVVLIALAACAACGAARADAVDALKAFVRDAKSGQSAFTQTVTSPDGAKKRASSGRFEFSRPNRFRFAYAKPFEQTIVGDGRKVWLYDADLNQASSRKLSDALGATPAALLAGASIGSEDFELSALPDRDGLAWAEAVPRAARGGGGGSSGGSGGGKGAASAGASAAALAASADAPNAAMFQSMRFGFRGSELAAVEIVDGFGQKSLLQFTGMKTNVPIAPETFRFTPPKGADVIEQ